MTDIEHRLRQELKAQAERINLAQLRQLKAPRPRGKSRTRRWLAPVAATAAGRRLRGGLRLLLEGPYLGQRSVIHDVSDRVARALLAEPASGLAPAVRPHAELLAEQRDQDLGLVGAEPGQFREPRGQLLAGRSDRR